MSVVDLREVPDFTANPYPYYAKLRAEGPVHTIRTDGLDHRIWLIVGYEEARAALADQRFGKNWRLSDSWAVSSNPINANMLEMDGPEHARLRKLVSREFTPGVSRRCARASSRSPVNSSTRWCPPGAPILSTPSPSRCR